jgi:hypothetical protein
LHLKDASVKAKYDSITDIKAEIGTYIEYDDQRVFHCEYDATASLYKAQEFLIEIDKYVEAESAPKI